MNTAAVFTADDWFLPSTVQWSGSLEVSEATGKSTWSIEQKKKRRQRINVAIVIRKQRKKKWEMKTERKKKKRADDQWEFITSVGHDVKVTVGLVRSFVRLFVHRWWCWWEADKESIWDLFSGSLEVVIRTDGRHWNPLTAQAGHSQWPGDVRVIPLPTNLDALWLYFSFHVIYIYIFKLALLYRTNHSAVLYKGIAKKKNIYI